MIVSDLIITSLETITGFDIVTGDYLFTLDELQDATLAQTQDKVDITGKQGRKLSSIKRNKAVTVSGTNGLINTGLFELQTGADFAEAEGTAEVMWADYIASTGAGAATSTFKAIGTAGAEVDAVYVKNADGTLGKKLEQAAAAAAGKFKYEASTKTFTFDEGDVAAAGVELVAYYKRKLANAMVLKNESDKYSEKCALYIDAIAEDKCANMYRVQFYIPKADFNGEFSIAMGGDQVVHAFEAEALSGACGTSGELFTFTVFGANEEDAA